MERIIYNSKKREYKSHFGALPTNKKCTFSIDILKSENPDCATLCVREDGHVDFVPCPMAFLCEVGEYLRFSCEISLEHPSLYFYRFEFVSNNQTRFCGIKDGKAQIGEWLAEWQLTVYDENFDTPEWAKNKIMYQIFPDRFCHSSNYMKNSPKKDRIVVKNWNSIPETQGKDFFIGNLVGIIEKLPYIKEMNVDIIYLSPILESSKTNATTLQITCMLSLFLEQTMTLNYFALRQKTKRKR